MKSTGLSIISWRRNGGGGWGGGGFMEEGGRGAGEGGVRPGGTMAVHALVFCQFIDERQGGAG